MSSVASPETIAVTAIFDAVSTTRCGRGRHEPDRHLPRVRGLLGVPVGRPGLTANAGNRNDAAAVGRTSKRLTRTTAAPSRSSQRPERAVGTNSCPRPVVCESTAASAGW